MWRFLQQGSLDGCWYWDLETPDQEWMSPEFWALLGIDPATKRHDPSEWQDLIFAEDRDLALENFQRHCADASHPYDQVVRYRHADGSTVWVRCRGIAIRDATGKPIRMLGAHNDLTAIKTAEQKIIAEKDAGLAAHEELQSFAYSISHDLKSPANTLDLLLGELQTGQADRMDQDGRELLTMSLQTVHRMQRLIDDVMRYTRVIGDDGHRETIDLKSVVEDVVADLHAMVQQTGGTIDVGDLPPLTGNSNQVRILFQNLLENAFKYRNPDVPPRITVSEVRAADGRSRAVSVSDNGIGISEENQDRIFAMFHRLHRQEDIPGSGLGLSMCRRIAKSHGGHIAARSTQGKGSTFTVSFATP